MAEHRSAPLCWGQRAIWLDHYQLPPESRHELHFTITSDPPAGSTIENLRLALDSLVRRHESLRSRYVWNEEHGAVQVVDPPGRMPVTCYDTTDRANTPLTAVLTEISTAEFRLDEEWPLRVCIVSTGAVPKRMVVMGHHIAMDDWSLDVIRQEFAEIHAGLVARSPVRLAPVRYHPVDLARHEASWQARETNERALAYWDRELARMPADIFASRRRSDAVDQTAHSATLSSPAALTAGREVAARHKVWPSLIHTAAFTALLAAYTGSRGVAYQNYASNRDRAPHADMVSCLFQPGLVYTDCTDDPPFDELIHRTVRDCGEAMNHSYFAYDEALELTALRGHTRGEDIRLGTAVNFVKYPHLRRGGQRTAFNPNPRPRGWARLEDDCYLRISEWQDCTVMTLYAADTVMAAADVERFLRGMEALLVRCAAAPASPRVSEIAGLAGFSSIAGEPPRPDRSATCADSERLLAEAVTEVNDLAAVDLSRNYVVAGGRIMQVPRLRDVLRRRDRIAPSLRQFAGTQPLRYLAADMPTPPEHLRSPSRGWHPRPSAVG